MFAKVKGGRSYSKFLPIFAIFLLFLCAAVFYFDDFFGRSLWENFSGVNYSPDKTSRDPSSMVIIRKETVTVELQHAEFQMLEEPKTTSSAPEYIKVTDPMDYVQCLKKTSDQQPNFDFDQQYQSRLSPDQCETDVRIVYLIKTTVDRVDFRRTLRETWAQDSLKNEFSVKRIFLLGETLTKQEQDTVEHEARSYNDILQGRFEEDKRQRSRAKKVVLGMKFFREHCKQAELLVIVNERTMIIPWNFFSLLNSTYFNDERRDDISGKHMENDISEDIIVHDFVAGFSQLPSCPVRGDWSDSFVSYDEYPCEDTPSHVTEDIVVYSNWTVAKLLIEAQRYQPPLFMDNVYFSILAIQASLNFTSFPNSKRDSECKRALRPPFPTHLSRIAFCLQQEPTLSSWLVDEIRESATVQKKSSIWSKFCTDSKPTRNLVRFVEQYCNKTG